MFEREEAADILGSQRAPRRAAGRAAGRAVVLRVRRSTAVAVVAAVSFVAVFLLRESVAATEARAAAADRAFTAASPVDGGVTGPAPSAQLGRVMCRSMDQGTGPDYAMRYPAMMGLHSSPRMGEEARWRALALAAALLCPEHAEAVRDAYVRHRAGG